MVVPGLLPPIHGMLPAAAVRKTSILTTPAKIPWTSPVKIVIRVLFVT
tara:strand:- start:85 stop:228 length:144 start_codon:yes stop_codon:yes gene_type:complete